MHNASVSRFTALIHVYWFCASARPIIMQHVCLETCEVELLTVIRYLLILSLFAKLLPMLPGVLHNPLWGYNEALKVSLFHFECVMLSHWFPTEVSMRVVK